MNLGEGARGGEPLPPPSIPLPQPRNLGLGRSKSELLAPTAPAHPYTGLGGGFGGRAGAAVPGPSPHKIQPAAWTSAAAM